MIFLGSFTLQRANALKINEKPTNTKPLKPDNAAANPTAKLSKDKESASLADSFIERSSGTSSSSGTPNNLLRPIHKKITNESPKAMFEWITGNNNLPDTNDSAVIKVQIELMMFAERDGIFTFLRLKAKAAAKVSEDKDNASTAAAKI